MSYQMVMLPRYDLILPQIAIQKRVEEEKPETLEQLETVVVSTLSDLVDIGELKFTDSHGRPRPFDPEEDMYFALVQDLVYLGVTFIPQHENEPIFCVSVFKKEC